NRVLRTYGARIGIDPRYTLLDRADARELCQRCLDDFGAEQGLRRLPSAATLGAILSIAVATGCTLEHAVGRVAPRLLDSLPTLRDVADRFQRRKAARALLDFDDILLYWKLLLEERDDVRRELEERFAHVLVDEYQDASPLQAELMERSAAGSRNLM